MKSVYLSSKDSWNTIIQKCNLNFRRLELFTKRSKKQIKDDIIEIIDSIVEHLSEVTIPDEFSELITELDIPGKISDVVSEILDSLDIAGQISEAISDALSSVTTTTLSDFMTEDGCTVTACSAKKWGDVAFIRFSYRLNSSLTVPSNGDVTDVTLGRLKLGWLPLDMTNVILDQTRMIVGDVGNDGVIQIRSANSRGTSYTIDANAVLYASMFLMLGLQ